MRLKAPEVHVKNVKSLFPGKNLPKIISTICYREGFLTFDSLFYSQRVTNAESGIIEA